MRPARSNAHRGERTGAVSRVRDALGPRAVGSYARATRVMAQGWTGAVGAARARARAPVSVKAKLAGRGDRERFLPEARTLGGRVGGWDAVGAVLAAGGV